MAGGHAVKVRTYYGTCESEFDRLMPVSGGALSKKNSYNRVGIPPVWKSLQLKVE